MDTTTEAATVADTIRNAAAWWRLAAEQIEAGDLVHAEMSAKLGQFCTEGMVERVAGIAAAAPGPGR